MGFPKLDYRSLRWPLGVLAVVVLALVVGRQWEGFVGALEGARIGPLLALLPVATVLTVLAPTGWHLIIRRLGADIRWSRSVEIWLVAATARFIPGGIWAFAGRYALARNQSIGGSATAVSMYLETLLIATTSLAVGIPALLLKHADWPVAVLGLLLILVLGLLLRPGIVRWLVQRFSPSPEPPSSAGIPVRGLGLLAAFYAAYWCLWGLWFAGFASCFHAVPAREAVYLACCFALAYWAGFVTLVFPGGVGIREGVLFTLLLPVFPADVALAVSVSSRFWMICAELPALLAAVAWARLSAMGLARARLPEQQDVGR